MRDRTAADVRYFARVWAAPLLVERIEQELEERIVALLPSDYTYVVSSGPDGWTATFGPLPSGSKWGPPFFRPSRTRPAALAAVGDRPVGPAPCGDCTCPDPVVNCPDVDLCQRCADFAGMYSMDALWACKAHEDGARCRARFRWCKRAGC
jgi:hypothetical protein